MANFMYRGEDLHKRQKVKLEYFVVSAALPYGIETLFQFIKYKFLI